MNAVPGVVHYEISQVAMVVHDLQASMREYNRLFGWGPWSVYEYDPPRLRNVLVRGEPAELTWVGAETEVGAVWVELLQPISGDAVFGDWLARHGEGVHHVGYWAKNQDEAARIHDALSSAGADELFSAWIDDVYFFYMDTRPTITEVWTGDLDSLRASRTYP
jgi:methylmalonyl-CoA/ethylmalonyl-CoA epimerase